MKLLLLGKNGQLGHELAQQLPALGRVMAIGREHLDLRDLSAVQQLVLQTQPDILINAAAYTAVDKAESDQLNAYMVNAAAPAMLAMAAKSIGAMLVHYSTDYVFDGSKATPYTPDDPPNPINYYGYSKLLGEQSICYSGCDYLILRTSWVYHPHYGHNFYRTIQRLAKEREVLRIVADQHGIANDARDLARDTLMLLRQPLAHLRAHSGIYHLTADLTHQTTWYQFACRILSAMPSQHTLCQRIEAITSADYPTAARRPAYSVMQRCLPPVA